MPPSSLARDGARAPSAAEANEEIRRFCAGRVWWSQEALDELARLRAAWLAAWRDELVRAA